jgi:hypothetical protein
LAVGLGYGAKSIAVASVDPEANRQADTAVLTAGSQGLQVGGGLATQGVAAAGDLAGGVLTETRGLAADSGVLAPPTSSGLPVQPDPTTEGTLP